MAADGEETVRAERHGAVLVLTLDRPDRLNALGRPLRDGLRAGLEAAQADASVRAIVLTGAGRAFSAGGDLDEITAFEDMAAEVREGFSPLARLLVESPKPIVAAINGPAAGAGLGLALCCDQRVLAEEAFVSCAFAGIGLSPDTGVSWALPRLVGHSRAFEIAATGRRVPAEEALRIGLVDRTVPAAEVLSTALALADDLARGPGVAIALTKRLLHDAATSTLADALEAEAVAQAEAVATEDFREGVAAFRDRRPPAFQGR